MMSYHLQWQFYYFPSNRIPFISFSSLITVALPKLCWIRVVRVNILVFFLILGEMVFHHCEWWLVWFCHIWPFIMLSSLYAHSLESFYHKWVLNFVKSFLCDCWDDHVIFIFQFVKMVYHTDWLAYTEKFLHHWDKWYLIIVNDPLVCWILFTSILWGFFCVYVHQWYLPVVFTFCDIYVWFWYHSDGGLIELI